MFLSRRERERGGKEGGGREMLVLFLFLSSDTYRHRSKREDRSLDDVDS